MEKEGGSRAEGYSKTSSKREGRRKEGERLSRVHSEMGGKPRNKISWKENWRLSQRRELISANTAKVKPIIQ